MKTVRHVHLAAAFACYAAIAACYGQEASGPTYEEIEMLEELQAKKKEGEPAWAA